jgi:Fur family ferric uptake transcriptional regulator|tara:strand:- start:3 stop:437 length:435 start_codon:yes stop_codon:yes gene_type:complete
MSNKSKDILLEHNISITNPRILVLEQLLKIKKPISIDSLLNSLNDQVATSTLYRVLNDLQKINIVTQFLSPESTTMVELSLNESGHHHHLFCKGCGDVTDIELSLGFEQKLSNEVKMLEKTLGFLIDDHGLELIGECNACRDSV